MKAAPGVRKHYPVPDQNHLVEEGKMATQESITRSPQRKKKAFRFTIESLTALPATTKRRYYYDTKEPRLGLTHLPPTKTYPDGKKTFFARSTIKGRTRRITLDGCVFPGTAIDTAREGVVTAINAVAKGT
jgi:hypothetical protein